MPMFIQLIRNMGERYTPLYFLAALGAGGLVVTFFMYLLFWVPHPNQPIPVFEDIINAWSAGGAAMRAAITVALLGIGAFVILHLRLLIWNLREFTGFRRTPAYLSLRNGNAETQLLAIPLTLAMTVNAMFIGGAVFVPGLWSIVEYLFPAAMIAFLAIGIYALRLLTDFFGRVLVHGGFDCAKNNSFAQMLPAFALAMVGVGLAAPSAMSTIKLTAGVSLILSSFFITAAMILGGVKLVLGFRAMLEQGASKESLPTLWIAVPVVTVITIALMRQGHALHEHFGEHNSAAGTFKMLTSMLSIQIFFTLVGYVVMRRAHYFATYITGSEKSAGSYALVCPGVALSVMGHFYINKALVATGLLTKFTASYWIVSAVPIVLQVAMIWLVIHLNARLLSEAAKPTTGEAIASA
jgi:hypothetical protein